jgi:hypothetical protein
MPKKENVLLTSLIYYQSISFVLHVQNRYLRSLNYQILLFFVPRLLEGGFRMALPQLGI